MAYDKPFLDLDKQIDLLISRNLIISDREHAKQIIMTTSYYDLFNGYKSVFMNPDDTFKSDTTIESIYIFSFIDKGLQSVTMKYSLMVETLFKTRLAYVISEHLGVHQDDYLHSHHYKQKVHGLTFQNVKQEIQLQLNLKHAKQPTKYYLKHHNHVPAWILFKNISFGSAINLFKFLNTKHKIAVANALLPTNAIAGKDKIELLLNTLEAIRRFRNCAAHSLNFFGCRSVYNIPGNVLYNLLPKGVLKREKGEITKTDKKALRGLYGVLIMMVLLLNDTLLITSLIYECRTVFRNAKSNDIATQAIIDFLNELNNKYKQATDLPIDFEDKLELIHQSIIT